MVRPSFLSVFRSCPRFVMSIARGSRHSLYRWRPAGSYSRAVETRSRCVFYVQTPSIPVATLQQHRSYFYDRVARVYSTRLFCCTAPITWKRRVPLGGQLSMNSQQPRIEVLEPAEVARLLEAGKLLLIDVREPPEYAAERIHGALLYPLSTFDATTLPPDGPRLLVFHCGTGKRSLTAAERRLTAGQQAASHMNGGLTAWKAAGLPVIAPTP